MANIFATADLVGFEIENTTKDEISLTPGGDAIPPGETKTLTEIRTNFCEFKKRYLTTTAIYNLFEPGGGLVATPITSPGNGTVCNLGLPKEKKRVPYTPASNGVTAVFTLTEDITPGTDLAFDGQAPLPNYDNEHYTINGREWTFVTPPDKLVIFGSF